MRLLPAFLSIPLLFLLAFSASALSPDEIDRLHRAAQTKEEALKLKTLIKESLQKDPSSAELSWRLARTYLNLGELSENESRLDYLHRCYKQAKRAIKRDERSASAYFLKGVCNGKRGEERGVWSSLFIVRPFKRDITTALKLDPSVFEGGPHRALGKYYYELPKMAGRDLKKSIEHLKEAVRLGPRFDENYLFLAESYYAAGDYHSAREALLTLKTLSPAANRPIQKRADDLLDKVVLEVERRD